jgi:hypothetical protein
MALHCTTKFVIGILSLYNRNDRNYVYNIMVQDGGIKYYEFYALSTLHSNLSLSLSLILVGCCEYIAPTMMRLSPIKVVERPKV